MKKYCAGLIKFAVTVTIVGATSSFAHAQDAEIPPPRGSFDPSKTLRVEKYWPILDEQNREWTDVSGRKMTARLGGRTPNTLIFYKADGDRIEVEPKQLSLADRAYGIYKTEKRANRTSLVLLGKMTKIIDGDVFEMKTIENENVTIKMDGIDAPEMTQKLGPVASKWLARFKDQDIRVEYFEKDRVGRYICQVYVLDRWINYEMVLAGIAWHDHRTNVDRRLKGAHAHAKKYGVGMWQIEGQVAPWDYREKNPNHTVKRRNAVHRVSNSKK